MISFSVAGKEILLVRIPNRLFPLLLHWTHPSFFFLLLFFSFEEGEQRSDDLMCLQEQVFELFLLWEQFPLLYEIIGFP